MADVDCDWEVCEYQQNYNLTFIYHGKNKFIVSLPNIPTGTGGK